MSELRLLADAAEYLFKEVCKAAYPIQLASQAMAQPTEEQLERVKSFLGQGLEVLSRLAAEQEALSPALQTTNADPEGEWQWVPNTHATVPLEPTTDMLYFGEMAEPNLLAFHPGKVYTAMLRARPPVPKKGERV